MTEATIRAVAVSPAFFVEVWAESEVGGKGQSELAVFKPTAVAEQVEGNYSSGDTHSRSPRVQPPPPAAIFFNLNITFC